MGGYGYSLGTKEGSNDLFGWEGKSQDFNGKVRLWENITSTTKSGLYIQDKASAYCNVKIKNTDGLVTEAHASIITDTSGPEILRLTDGSSTDSQQHYSIHTGAITSTVGRAFQSENSYIAAHWGAIQDQTLPS